MGSAWAAGIARRAVTTAMLVAAAGGAGCGGGTGVPAGRTLPDAARPPPAPRDERLTVAAPGGDDGDDDGMGDGLEIDSTRGSVDPSVVSAQLEPRGRALEACYSDRVGRRKWLGGGVELAWDVGGDGAIGAVRIASSDLGAWPIEKCVLAVARGVSFGKPRGNKPARVTAPLSFSAGTGAVRWDDDKAALTVKGRLSKLATCARAAPPTNVTITIYLGTRGRVETVGFASPGGFAEDWADCAERAILGWALTDPRGKVAKLSVVYNPADVADDATDDDDRDL